MSLAQERHDPLAVLDAVIADMRASGDTGHVENLLQARADIDAVFKAVSEAHGCFIAAEVEGWSEAVRNGDVERIADLWRRRIQFATAALESSLSIIESAP